MIKRTYQTSDGIVRTIAGRHSGNSFHVQEVHGDITSEESLAEMAQQIASEFVCEHVTMAV